MLAQQHRFTGSRAIQRLYRVGQSARTKRLGLRYQTESGQSFRAVIIVSRKVHKSAVVRNRIRRRLYEILRTDYAKHLDGVQLVITVFDVSLATMTAEEVRSELANLLSKAQSGGRPKARRDIVKDTGV